VLSKRCTFKWTRWEGFTLARGRSPYPPSRLLAEIAELDSSLEPLRRRILATSVESVPGLHGVLVHAQPRTSFDVRPFLFRCGFEFGRCSFRRVLPIALALQLANTATLIVDDILDHSAERDGHTTVRIAFGTERAVLAALLLKSAASRVFLDVLEASPHLPHKYVAYRCFEQAYADLHRGQFLDLELVACNQVTESDYFQMIYLTTGRLIEMSLFIGGLLGGTSARTQTHLLRFGKILGLIHQVRDDIADYWPERFDLGRPAGEDLRERKRRLPLLYALQTDGREGATLRRILQKQRLQPHDLLKVREILDATGAFERVRRRIRDLYQEAEGALGQLPQRDSTDRLRALLRYFRRV
jgi:geranylgeranyl pyrophosphate synthase